MHLVNIKEGRTTCGNCGEVHFPVTRGYAEAQVHKFNEYYQTLHIKEKGYYGGPATVLQYEKCKNCGGNYKEFKDFREGDCPEGCTINPIIDRRE